MRVYSSRPAFMCWRIVFSARCVFLATSRTENISNWDHLLHGFDPRYLHIGQKCDQEALLIYA